MSEDEDRHQQEYRQLLQFLKGTVEGLLISQVSNVWNIYGGLTRLHTAMDKIFKHACRVFSHDGEPDLWVFIQGLSWLQPSLAASPTFLGELEDSVPDVPQQAGGKAWIWLYKSLQGHTLSHKLSWLLSDREHLHSCFEKYAFLCQEKYSEATLICLRAVEQNQPSLLTEIDPCLYLSTWNLQTHHKTHRRCSSFPEAGYNVWRGGKNKNSHFKLLKQTSEGSQQTTAIEVGVEVSVVDDPVKIEKDTILTEVEPSVTQPSNDEEATPLSENLKSWCSLPNLVDENMKESSSLESTDLTQSCSVPGRYSRVGQLKSGSQTLPSSPAKFQTPDCKVLTTENVKRKNSDINKLSPSILEIDYSVHSDTPPSASEHKTFLALKSNRDFKPIPLKNLSKGAIIKKQSRIKEDSVTKLAAMRGALNCNENSSCSSDTLNPETNRSSDESQLSTFKDASEHDKPNVRPSDLKLSVPAWDKTDGMNMKEQPSTSTRKNKGTHGKQQQRKTIIVGSAPEYAGEWLSDEHVTPRNGHFKLHKKSFIESGGSSVQPMSTGFFPRPIEGQSLTSFLSSGQFSRPSAELDRENAHFSISEAMIAAIEQVKCKRQLRVAEETGEVCDESDEEINHLKQRIRMRRRQRQEERQRHLLGMSLLSDGKTDTTTTDQSVSPLSSSPGTPSESISTDDVDDLEVDEVKNLAQLKNSGLSVSMASLYSEADLSKHPPLRTGTDIVVTESVVSAEGVALSLLRQFGEKHLPRASDLQWLVSEQDAPQQLLPLPTSWPVSPDEAEDLDMRQATPLRGTTDWAPPRPQVIFTPHPPPVRRVLMVKQNYRCAGCGMKVAPEYANKFRYCEYLGRYFCTGCHTNQLALIPGKVLTRWDFTRYPVSSFSYRLLDQMLMDPLFRIGDHSPGLYRKARQLERSRQLRMQLFYLKDFVISCRFAKHLQEALQKEPVYLLMEQDTYSMNDLVQVKSGELVTRLRELVSSSSQHVAECQLCQARGFVCELCRSQEVIYPWQLGKVTRCGNCGACFHTACWTPSPCRRCNRINERRLSRETQERVPV